MPRAGRAAAAEMRALTDQITLYVLPGPAAGGRHDRLETGAAEPVDPEVDQSGAFPYLIEREGDVVHGWKAGDPACERVSACQR